MVDQHCWEQGYILGC